jgi:hypothetical protein
LCVDNIPLTDLSPALQTALQTETLCTQLQLTAKSTPAEQQAALAKAPTNPAFLATLQESLNQFFMLRLAEQAPSLWAELTSNAIPPLEMVDPEAAQAQRDQEKREADQKAESEAAAQFGDRNDRGGRGSGGGDGGGRSRY